MPPRAPDLWGHPSLEYSSFSHAMRAARPWNVTFSSRIFLSGSLLVSCLNASSAPHAWAPRDLGFSLTDNWCVVCHQCPIFHRPNYIAEDTSVHPRDRHLTALRNHGPRASQNNGPRRSWDPAYVDHHYLQSNEARGLVGSQSFERSFSKFARLLFSFPLVSDHRNSWFL